MHRLLSFSVLVMALCGAERGGAAEKAGVRFPPSVDMGGRSLTLNGLGVREATIFNVDVYVAALYLERKSADPEAVLSSTTAKHLALSFVRDVDRDDIVSAFKEGFEKNAVPGEQPVQKLLSLMKDMKDGDLLSFTIVGSSVEILINGQSQGRLSGPGFARAFLGIWLGPEPPNSGLKEGLLGQDE